MANELRQEFGSRIAALERAADENNDPEFREQVFSEIDGIKAAAIEDIKNLDNSVKGLAQEMNNLKKMKQKEPVIQCIHNDSLDHHQPCCSKRVSFGNAAAYRPSYGIESRQSHSQSRGPIEPSHTQVRSIYEHSRTPKKQTKEDEDTDLERADEPFYESKGKRGSPRSTSIVVMNSQRNLDSNMNKSDRSRSRRSGASSPRSSNRMKGATYTSPKNKKTSPVRHMNPSGCECRDHYRDNSKTTQVMIEKQDGRGNSVVKQIATVAKNVSVLLYVYPRDYFRSHLLTVLFSMSRPQFVMIPRRNLNTFTNQATKTDTVLKNVSDKK